MGRSSAKDRRAALQAEWRARFREVDAQLAAIEAVKANFVGPPKPPKRSGLAEAMRMLLSPAPADLKRLGLHPAPLTSERARELSRKRWRARDVAKEAALDFAGSLAVDSRAAAARRVVQFLEQRGCSLTVDTADRWLRDAHWAPPR